ncbi:MAG: hypothetical protein E7536_04885 [Ruminococcaceae bacterium]|nr:hypothetical protein [Oscillospiraceae bacterium]
MKKSICLLMAFIMCFSLASCSSKEEEPTTTDQYLHVAPILGVKIETEDNAGFYALTKNGAYTWLETKETGEEKVWSHTGAFCLDMEDTLCKFTREQTGGKVTLQFTGNVADYKIYQAPCEEIESDKKQIIDEKYLIGSNSPTIVFPESGKYYYVVDVTYFEGQVPYGFMLAE